eukprot:3475382-Pyramimonas_sp.AAC.1
MLVGTARLCCTRRHVQNSLGNSVDVKGNSVDVKGNIVDVKGRLAPRPRRGDSASSRRPNV